LNTKGGDLLIGISEVGEEKVVYGIEKDIHCLKGRTRDEFSRHLSQIIENHIGREFAKYFSFEFIVKDSKTICRVSVEPCTKPVFLNDEKKGEFYIRRGAASISIDPADTTAYISMQWPK
jgi:predicted HTH transcriptional regulator